MSAPRGPRILLIGSSYRALFALERLLDRGERVVAFLGEEGFGEQDFCPEILELCDRAGVPARAARRFGEEVARWLDDRIRPELAIRVGLRGELPLAIGGNCRMGLVELDVSESGERAQVVLRQQGREVARRSLDAAKADERASQLFVRVTEELLALLEQHLDQFGHAHVRVQPRVPFAAQAPLPDAAEAPAPARAAPARRQLEREIAARLGAAGARLYGSAAELGAALARALGLGPGDEVALSALGSPLLARGLARGGAELVFGDVEPGALALDPRALRPRLSEASRALVVSQALGAAPLAALAALARERGLALIEDAGGALGARAGEAGWLGGGAQPCAFELAELAGAADPAPALLCWPAGWAPAARLPAAGGAACAELAARAAPRLESCVRDAEARARLAAEYARALRRYDAFALPAPGPAACFPLGITAAARTGAEDLYRLLREAGVEVRRIAPAASARALAEAPRAAAACETRLLLPLHPGLGPEQQQTVLDALFDYAVG